jgi:hypothetical protein
MVRLPVAKIILDANLGLLVVPEAGSYEHIYRMGNGVSWSSENCAFCAFEPQRWKAEELLRHIAAAVAGEYGEELYFTSKTSWHSIGRELQESLVQVLAC